MLFGLKKIAKTILVNCLLLISLIICIQNSNNKTKVNLIFIETIDLPISFIVGFTFISGSFLGSLLPFEDLKKK